MCYAGLNGSLFRQPASCLLEFVRRKKLHRRAAHSGSGKSERESLPAGLSDDGDLGNLTAVRDQKVEIIPIRATLPALKVSRITSNRGFDPVSILRASALCSAPNSDRFKTPLMCRTQMSLG
jgi:hypothetical protein